MSALTLDAIAVERGERRVLDAVTLTFAPGRLTAVIGPNGAGKSSMLDVAAGLLRPASGSVRLGEQELGTIGRRMLARRRAYLPQRASVEWPISVERVVALGLTPSLPAFGDLPASMRPAIDEALAACDLLGMRDRPATSLSGGELARAMLARAIVADPELLIVDEPTAGLDPRHALDAMRRLRARADAGRTVIVAIHDIDLALNHADDLVALKDGRLLAAGPVDATATEALLTRTYDVPVRLTRDADGVMARFLTPKE
jgi:iron complex transport system ATP-binding protein